MGYNADTPAVSLIIIMTSMMRMDCAVSGSVEQLRAQFDEFFVCEAKMISIVMQISVSLFN